MTKQALIALRDKVAAGDNEGWRECVVELIDQERKDFKPEFIQIGRMMDGSLDAAVALLDDVLPGGEWVMRTNFDAENEPRFFANVWCEENPNKGGKCFPAYSDTPPRALLLATLDALIEGAE